MAEEPIRKEDIIDLSGTQESINELIKTLENLSIVMRKDLKESADILEKSLQGVNAATKEGQERIKLAATESENLAAQQREMSKIDKETVQLKARLNALNSNEANEVAKLRVAIEGKNKSMKDAARLDDFAEGSINKMRARLKELTAEYNKLDPAVRKGAAPAINKLTEELKKAESAIGNNTRSVGNYTGALKKFGTGLLAATGFTAGFAGALKIGEGIIESTDALSDKFRITLSGWAGGFSAIARAIANNDFKNFFQNVKDAIAEGQRYAATQENIDDSMRAMKLRVSEGETAILNLRNEQAKATKTDKEKVEIGKQIQTILETNAEARTKLAEAQLKNDIQDAAFIAHTSPSLVKAYLEQDKATLSTVAAGKKYNQLLIDLAGTVNTISTGTSNATIVDEEAAKAIQEKIDAMGPAAAAYGGLAKGLESITDAQKDKLVSDYEAIEVAKQSAINLRVTSKTFTALAREEKKALADKKDENEAYGNWLLGHEEYLEEQKEKTWDEGTKYADLLFEQNKKRAEAEWEIVQENERKKAKAVKDAEEEKKAIIDDSFAAVSGSLNTLADLYEANKQRELSAAGDNAVKREEIERKYAKKQQILGIGQALINGAMAITEIWRKWAANPVIAGIFTALSVAQTAAQVAIIKSQKFAHGGAGVLNGPGHASGGVLIPGVGEAEGGEHFAITSRNMTQHYGPKVLDAISNSINQGKFFEVWSNVNKSMGTTDPYTKKMYELMSNTPTVYIDTLGNTVKEYPNGQKYVIRRFYKN